MAEAIDPEAIPPHLSRRIILAASAGVWVWASGVCGKANVHKNDYDSRYLGFFECFNRQHFFEAHEVLEALWLPQRQAPDGQFYKGLIQLAGAFVHLQKNRLGPAAALFELARTNLRQYPPSHEGLNVTGVLALIEEWLRQLKRADVPANLILSAGTPQLRLEAPN